jgi:hypothetical protein
MKTSKKILITTAIFLAVLWTMILLVARKDIKTIVASRSIIEYSDVPVDRFDNLDFSSNWIVQVKQGKDCKLELGIGKDASWKPVLENKNQTLSLSAEEISYARVTAPVLGVIRAAGNTRIEMKMYWSDSVTVVLRDSSSFTGVNLDYDYITFKSSAGD